MTTNAAEEPVPWVSATKPATPPASSFEDRVAIVGRIVTTRGEGVAHRPFLAVDRTGERREGTTDARGGFWIEELRPPYDLRVGDTAWLGVTRVDPVVEIEGEETLVSEEVVVEVGAPPCGREACVVDVVSVSRTGRGGATAIRRDRAGPTTVIFQHGSREHEEIEVHALVHDAAFTVVAYARGRGVLEAQAVETRELSLDDDDDGVTLTLDVPGGASFAIGRRLPRVEGATWRMERRAVAPSTASVIHRSSRAWSGTLAIDDDPPALPLPVGPEILRPHAGGLLSGRGTGLSWGVDPRTLFTADVVDVARGAFRYRVVTNASELPSRRMEALDFPRLRPGAHTLSLTTAPFAGVDEAVSSDVEERRRRFDERRAGAGTYETIAFTVSP